MTPGEQEAFVKLQDELQKALAVIKALKKALQPYITRQRVSQIQSVARGECKRCGKPRATAQWCRSCADKWNSYQRNGSKAEQIGSPTVECNCGGREDGLHSRSCAIRLQGNENWT